MCERIFVRVLIADDSDGGVLSRALRDEDGTTVTATYRMLRRWDSPVVPEVGDCVVTEAGSVLRIVSRHWSGATQVDLVVEDRS